MRHAWTCLILATLLLAGCRDGNEAGREVNASDRRISSTSDLHGDFTPSVVCTTGMIADIAINVGGDAVEVRSLMGPGVDPHLYQATTSDMQALADADIIFYNGLHLEAKLGDLLVKLASQRPVVAVTRDIPEDRLLSPEEFEGLPDPHVWMDVDLWSQAAETLRDTLIELDPDSAETYSENCTAYTQDLLFLKMAITDLIKNVPQESRVLITAHDAFNYFGEAYGFEVRGLQGISTQAEAGTADVRELAQFIVDRKIPAIFVESSVPQRNIEAVQAACASRGFDVAIGGELFSDAMGSAGTKEGTYKGMIEHNVYTIVEALSGMDLRGGDSGRAQAAQ